MQLLIDTDTIPMAELGAIVNFLDDILVIRRGKEEPTPAAANDQPLDKLAAEYGLKRMPAAEAADIRAAIHASVPPPPPPKVIDSLTVTIGDVVGGDDPEVEFDNDGGVTALAAAAPPPPPPPASAPPPPPPIPAPPGPVVAAELDVRGMPYDARIHASNRAKKIDGSWKNRRGVDTALVATIEAQNKPGNVQRIPILVGPNAGKLSESVPPAAGAAPPPPPPPPLTAGGAAPAAAVPSAIDFRGLMQKIQAASAAGKLSDAQVYTAFASVGLKPEDMGQLINNAPLIASVNAAIDMVVK